MQDLICNLEDLETADLVRLAQDDDRDALGELIRRFEGVVYATAMKRLGNHAEAQELCQEVFVKAMEKLHQLNVPEAFVGWLRSITVRMAINRAVRRGPAIATEPETMAATCIQGETPLDSALSTERAQQVRAGMRQLGSLDQQTLKAFYFDGHSLAEMSNAFQAPVGTIKRRLHVARQRLAKQLEAIAV